MTDLTLSVMSSRGPGQPRGPKSAQGKGWSAEKKSNCVQRVPQGLKFLLIQTGSKLRNHFRGAEAIVADL